MRDEWEDKYNTWKAQKKKKEEQAKLFYQPHFIDKIEKAIESPVKEAEREIIKLEKETINYIKPRKSVVIIISLLLIVVIIGIIIYANYDPSKIRYQLIDIEALNSSGLLSQVFYAGKPSF